MVTSTAVPTGSIASGFGDEFNYVNLRTGLAGLQQRIAVFATYDPAKTGVIPDVPVQVFTAADAGDKFGFGFPMHLALRQVLRKSRAVPVYAIPIAEAGGAAAAAGTITATGPATSSGTISLYIGGQKTAVNILNEDDADAVATKIAAAVTANTVNLPVTAVVDGVTTEEVDITAKYKGAIGDDITIAVNLTEQEKDAAPAGVGLTIVDMTGGSGTPVVTTALNNFGDIWYTWTVNTFGPDTTVMDEFQTFNEDDRWDPMKNLFYRCFNGSVADSSTITAISDARKLDRTNGSIVSTGAYSLPLELASLAVGQMASRNQDNPPQPYSGLLLEGMTPGADSLQWDYAEADSSEKLGSSWTIVRDGVITLVDVLMYYHRTGEEPPAYRYAVDIAKLAEWANEVKLKFNGPDWEDKILIENDQFTSNPQARRPRSAEADMYKIIDAAADAALITDPEFSKANTAASIDLSNPNRINITTLIKLSGASRIKALTTNFGFNFGSLAT